MKHLAIIMDGNRRWAKARFLPVIFGHKAGYDTVKKITAYAQKKGIRYLTLWALSTENLAKREAEEIEGIIRLIHQVPSLIPEFMEKGVKLQIIGDIGKLPAETQDILSVCTENTKNNISITLTIALVYGGQDEIIRATKKILKAGIDPETLSAAEFRNYLDCAILPVPDMIVRTSGDMRHSGFLLYDSAYSEYYFTDKKWPEFDEAELDTVLETFSKRKRNFGK